MADITWYGFTRTATLNDLFLEACSDLSRHAKAYEWSDVFKILEKHPDMVNMPRIGGLALFTPLHHAAHEGASIEVVQRLLGIGAWRTLENARGELPLDVAERKGHGHLKEMLSPEYKHHVPFGVLRRIQEHFHAVIRSRADELVVEQALRLPELQPLLELEEPKMWFPISGMYGGFSFWLQDFGADAKLISESWSRAEAGSGERHEINSRGYKLVDEGFV